MTLIEAIIKLADHFKDAKSDPQVWNLIGPLLNQYNLLDLDGAEYENGDFIVHHSCYSGYNESGLLIIPASVLGAEGPIKAARVDYLEEVLSEIDRQIRDSSRVIQQHQVIKEQNQLKAETIKQQIKVLKAENAN